FKLQDGAREAYTRDGAFVLDAQGRLTSRGGLPVIGDGLYRNASNATAQEAPDARVRQGMLEGSNVNPIIEITNLIEIQRAYESVSKMIENANDLSRRSVERLGRVS
ncbi:MAG: flagellar biosynthesis protein FlgF, partial [Caulobacteraceae bacterium]